jgi:putative addiction module component (TIGR02574 family)
MTKEQIFSAAKGLDLDDRMDLVDDLMSTIDPDEQRKIDAAWAEEIERRIDEMDRGDVKAVPGNIVFEKIRAKHFK